MKNFFEKHQVLGIALSVFASIFLVTLISYSATTISTDIDTGGYASSTTSLNTQGALWVGTSATTSASHYIGGTASTTELFVQDNAHIGGFTTTSKLTIGTSTTHIRNLLFGDCTVDLSSVGANSTSTATCTATGVMPGDKIFVTPGEGLMRFLTFGGASSSANDTIQVQVGNSSSTAITDSTHTWYWMAMR